MRRDRIAPALMIAACLLAPAGRAALAQSGGTPPDQVEEDWEVVIGTPDPEGAGPQVSTYMSPVADGSSPFIVLDLNCRSNPSFSPGGLEAQVWQGDFLLSWTGKGTNALATAGEKITWTQRMRVSSGALNFAIDSGRSTTWGKFGQGQQLNINSSFPTTLTSLSGYSPATSLANSGVGWQRNRVASMAIVEIRYYAGGKLLSTDKTRRPINLAD